MNIKFKIVLFVISLVALLAFQSKLVMPWAEKIAASDLFLEDTGDPGSQIPVSTDMTQFAFNQCNSYVSKELGENFSVTFPKIPLNSWAIGNYEYVINADVDVTTKASGAAVKQRYACNIRYKNKADKAGVANADNWVVDGLSGLTGL
jgi:hypothetical protein